jgi:hypothetical protein
MYKLADLMERDREELAQLETLVRDRKRGGGIVDVACD